VLIDHLPKNVILLLGPGPFGHEGVILQLEPSIETLDLRSASNTFADFVPSLISELLNERHEL
jgi:hypothetical protein